VLDPEIQPIVDLMEAAEGPPAHLVPIAQARAAHDKETAVMSGPGEDVAEVRDVEAPGPGGPIPVRLFRPLHDRAAGGAPASDGSAGGAPASDASACGAPASDASAGGALPLVAYLHGGGWVLGTLDAFDPVCRALANASGALVASIGYRLAPEHPFPAAPDDARAAVRWLAAHADELGADPARLGIAGDSAGGNLAAVTARRLRDDGDPPLRFQALIYPVCDSSLNTPSYRDNGAGFGLSGESMKRYWELYLDGADGRHPDASPLQAADLTGLPPAYVLTVRHDVLRDEGEAYARALEAAGVPVTLSRYDGAVHGFFRWIGKAQIARAAVAEAGAALRAGLAYAGPR
jgi:acetyl esterase